MQFSELLTQLENMGLVISYRSSKVRRDCGTEYKLIIPPEIVRRICVRPEWWGNIVKRKQTI